MALVGDSDSPHGDAFVIPVERFCPPIYRMMSALQIRHLLECNRLRFMLSSVCAISVIYCIFCFMSIFSLTCYACQPWTAEELGDYTRLFRLVESASMAMLFWFSWRASFHYIEGDDQRLQEKEEQFSDLETKTEDAIKQMSQQANRHYELMHDQISEKVKRMVLMMRNILKKLKAKEPKEPKAKKVWERLSKAMARSLDQLRQPAFEQFKTLIDLYGGQCFLEEALCRMQKQSMLVVLDPDDGAGLLRSKSFASTLKPSGRSFAETDNEGFESTITDFLNDPQANCQELINSVWPKIKPWFTSSPGNVSEGLQLPSQTEMEEELKQFTVEEITKEPNKVVLRPLYLVLKWLKKIKVEPSCSNVQRRSTRRITNYQRGTFRPMRLVRQFSCKKLKDWLRIVKRKMKSSMMLRVFIWGLIYSCFLVCYYLDGVLIVAHVMNEGKCHGLEGASCLRALLQRLIGAIAFGWYFCAITYTTYHIDVIDQHIQFSKDLAALSQANQLVDKLNENELAQEDSNYSLWKQLMSVLKTQDDTIYNFFLDIDEKQLTDYEKLVADLKKSDSPWKTARRVVMINRLARNTRPQPDGEQTEDEEKQGLLAQTS